MLYEKKEDHSLALILGSERGDLRFYNLSEKNQFIKEEGALYFDHYLGKPRVDRSDSNTDVKGERVLTCLRLLIYSEKIAAGIVYNNKVGVVTALPDLRVNRFCDENFYDISRAL